MTSPYRRLPEDGPAPKAAGPSSVVVPFNRNGLKRNRAEAPVPLLKRQTITAASKKINPSPATENSYGYGYRNRPAEWQNEAWALYDQVGELRYASNLFANGLSQLRLELGRTDDATGQITRLCDVKETDLTDTDKLVQKILREFSSDQNLSEMQRCWGINKFVVGESLMVGIPTTGKSRKKILDYTWKMYSRRDVHETNGVMKICGVEYDPKSVVIIRVWQPHPAVYMAADSPVRGSLPVLRELVGLTMHVSALIDSRLAGAGVLILPTSATVLGSSPPEDDQEEDPTVAALIEAMVTPIKDRDSAAAIVPLVLSVPDESAAEIRHISFSSPLDAESKNLRDEAIRRLALGFDMPPEQLLGLGHASHWSAWLVAEDTVRYQFVPGIKPFVDALLLEFIHPILIEAGVDTDLAVSYCFTVESDALIQRPNKFDEALSLYQIDAISLSAVLEAGGFRQTDAPEKPATQDRAVDLAIKAVGINPSLLALPGLPSLVSQFRAVLDGKDASNAPPSALPNTDVTENPKAQPPAEGPDSNGSPKESHNKPTGDGNNTPGPPRSSPSGPNKN